MLGRMGGAWDRLNSSYWFVPTVLGVMAAAVSAITLAVDRRIEPAVFLDVPFVPVFQTEGARSILTTVATSMITVGGVVFSLMLLTLTQAASQFGPRLLVNFMHDRTNQFVLGSFVATFVYALLVLRVVTGGDSDVGVEPFVPQVSVFVALLLTFATLAVLIYFFHHIAQSVRVTHILADIGRAMAEAIEDLPLFGSEARREEREASADDVSAHFDTDVGLIRAQDGGYLQEVRFDELIDLARDHEARVRLVGVVGTYVLRGAALAEVQPVTATDAIADEIHDALVFGEDRSLDQDLPFLFDEFLEIALRALSPSMNDPFTARSCIDRIAEGLILLDRRDLRREVHRDQDGYVRVIVPVPSKPDLVQHLLGELRHASKTVPLAALHLAATLSILRREIADRDVRSVIADELDALVEDVESTLSPRDHERLRDIAEGGFAAVDPTLA